MCAMLFTLKALNVFNVKRIKVHINADYGIKNTHKCNNVGNTQTIKIMIMIKTAQTERYSKRDTHSN